jgi:hypothetical protein
MLRSLRIVPLLLVTLLLTACGEEQPKVIDVGTRITTAADALECAPDAKVEARSVASGKRPGSPDAPAAVEAWAKRLRRSADIPLQGYEVGVEEVGTVLFTHNSDEGFADIAVIATRTDDHKGTLGWLVESWARCRPGDPLS